MMRGKTIHVWQKIIFWGIMLSLIGGLLVSCQSKEERQKTKAEDFYQKGMAFLEEGKIDEAILEFKNARAQNPDHVGVLYELGKLQIDQGEVGEGYGLLIRAAELDPDNMDARLRVAELYLFQALGDGNFEKVEAELNDLLERDEKNAKALLLRGRMYAAQAAQAQQAHDEELMTAKFDGALADIRSSIAQDPNNSEAYLVLGQIFVMREKTDEAQEALEKAIEVDPNNIDAYLALAGMAFRRQDIAEAESLYRKVLEIDPESLQGLAGSAELYVIQSKYAEAIDMASKVLELTQDAEGPPQRELVSAHFTLGRAYFAQADAANQQEPEVAKALYAKAQSHLEQATQMNPELTGAFYSLGLVHLRQQNYQQAIAQFEIVIRRNPTHVPTLVNLAIVHFQEGQYESAIEQARKVTQLDANNATAYEVLGSAYLRLNKIQEAQEAMDALAALKPDAPSLSINRAMAYYRNGEYAKAIEEATKAIEAGQKNAFVYNILGKSYLGANDVEQAERALKQALELDNTFNPAHLALGDLYVKQQQFELAEAEVNAILAQDPNSPEAHVLLGLIAMNRKQFEQAKVEFEKALAQRSDYGEAHYQLGVALRSLNQTDEAIASLERAVELLPDHLPSLVNLTLWTFDARDFTKALEYGQQAISIDPNNVLVRNALGALYAQTGQFSKALDQIQEIQKIQPDDPNVQLTLGVIYLGQREYEKAAEAAKKAIEQNPDNLLPYDTLGRAYLAQKMYGEALEAFTQALEREPDYVPALLGLGSLYGTQGKYFDAFSQYTKVLEIKPETPEAHLGLGGVYRMTGNQALALEQFETILTAQSTSSEVVLFNAADLALQLKKYDDAIAYSSRLLTENPQHVNAQYILAQAYLAKGEVGQATFELEDITRKQTDFQPAVVDLGLAYLVESDLEGASEQFQAVLRQNEKHLGALIGMAVTAQQQGLLQDAIAYCRKALEIQPTNQMVQTVLGNLYISNGDYDEARNAFAQADDLYRTLTFDDQSITAYYGSSPDSTAIELNLGSSLIARGWGKEAFDVYQRLDPSVKEGPLFRYVLAQAYATQGDTDRAIRELEALLEASPTVTIALKTLGTLYQGQERYDQAIASYQTYLESNPDDTSTQIQLGLAYQNADQLEEALTAYQQVLDASPDSALTKNQIAWLYADLGKELDTALQLAQEAEAARPVSGIIDTVGWVHYKREEYDLAIAKFQQALNITPLQPEIRYHLALAYAKQENSAGAIEELQYALRIDPNFSQAEAAQKMLDELQGQGN